MQITFISKDISNSGKDERFDIVKQDYEYRFKLYDDDNILYFEGYCNESEFDVIYEHFMVCYGITDLKVKKNRSRTAFKSVFG